MVIGVKVTPRSLGLSIRVGWNMFFGAYVRQPCLREANIFPLWSTQSWMMKLLKSYFQRLTEDGKTIFLLYNFLHLSFRLPNSCKILKDNWCFLSHFWGAKNTNMQKLNIVKYFVENKFLKFLNRFQFSEINYISLWKVIVLLYVQLISKYI